MAMTAASEDTLAFSCPQIAPKHYIVKGPSGWTETFLRAPLDAELVSFLAPVPPRDMAGIFIDMRALIEKPEPANWYTVVGFLGRTLGVNPRSIPHTVGIAFWATVELALHERVAN